MGTDEAGAQLQHRHDIDGLRALAVVPVVLFHAGYSTFGGGFIGVDVFFVVSGYLITRLILEQISEGRFSLLTFYERRARRILPALTLVVLVCGAAGWAWMTPAQLNALSLSAAATALFSSNILFYTEGGYFDLPSDLKPLLHTWSLSIEEQFYVVYPLLLLVILKFRPAYLVACVAGVAVVSFALAEWSSRHAPSAGFYLLHTRAWELLAGALIATWRHRSGMPELNSVTRALPAVGILLIVVSVVGFHDGSRHPSIYTAIPVAGAGLILALGGRADIGTRVLSCRACVAIGLISYSLYLWHAPIFVFAKIIGAYYDIVISPVPLIALSFALAAGTWKFVEQPFRQSRIVSTRRLWTSAGLATAAVLTLAFYGHANQGFVRWPPELAATFRFEDSTEKCFDVPHTYTTEARWHCRLGATNANPDYFVIGDSHALSMFSAFDVVGRDAEKSGLFAGRSGCVPLLGVYPYRSPDETRDCFGLNRRTFEFIAGSEIKTVFLVARWTYYTDGDYDGGHMVHLRMSPEADPTISETRQAFRRGFDETINAYAAIGVTVVVVSQVPMQLRDPQAMYLRALNDFSDPRGIDGRLRDLSVTVDQHNQLQAFVSGVFSSPFGDFHLIDTSSAMCDETACPVGSGTEARYWDDDHLTVSGSQILVPWIAAALSQ